MRKRTRSGVRALHRTVASAMLLGLAGSAAAQTGSQINACVMTATGRVRIVDGAGGCKKKEQSLSWAAAGTPGETGPQGPPGTPGSNGPPPCHAIGRLTLAGIVGDGAGGSMVVDAYHVALEPAPVGGPPNVIDFTVTKPVDKASPAIAMDAVLGTPIATGMLEIFAADGVTVATTYTLGTVLISSFASGAPASCSIEIPTENVSLSFATIVIS